MKHNFFFIIIIALLLNQCTSQNKECFDSSKLIGKWELDNYQVNYPELIFRNDFTAIFKSRGDTIYYYSYLIKTDTLFLIDIDNKINQCKIKVLNDRELVFDNLLEHNKRQIYRRKINDNRSNPALIINLLNNFKFLLYYEKNY